MSYLNAKRDAKSLLEVEPALNWLSITINGVEYAPVDKEERQNNIDIVTETFMHLNHAKKTIESLQERLDKYEKWVKDRP